MTADNSSSNYNNMAVYQSLRSVPSSAARRIERGPLAGKTNINPMWRLKALTETFGPVGLGWYIDDVTYETYSDTAVDKYQNTGHIVVVRCSLALHVKYGNEWSKPIAGVGGSTLISQNIAGGCTDEAYKMAMTDAISVACKMLGMGADVYWSEDATKYDMPSATAGYGRQREERQQDVWGAPPVTPAASRGSSSRVMSVTPQPRATRSRPLDDEQYWKIVEAYATGRKSKTGGDLREAWIQATGASREEIERFNRDVAGVAAARNPYAAERLTADSIL